MKRRTEGIFGLMWKPKFSELRGQMEQLDIEFRRRLFSKAHVPTELFQYTNISGLRGILESRRWRATHADYLNDSMEIKYADDMICYFLLQRLEVMTVGYLKDIYEEILGLAYGNREPSIMKAFDRAIYIISFSEEGNLLDQWRAYGADGAGYSIGIRPSDLKFKVAGPVIYSQSKEVHFIKVNYNQAQQAEAIAEIIYNAESIITAERSRVSASDFKEFNQEAARILTQILWQLTVFFKHPAYESEKEWRVVKIRWGSDSSSVQDVAFRERDGLLVPYISLDFSAPDDPVWPTDPPLMPISKIVLGPKHSSTNAIGSLKLFLRSIGYVDYHLPRIVVSEIPYR